MKVKTISLFLAFCLMTPTCFANETEKEKMKARIASIKQKLASNHKTTPRLQVVDSAPVTPIKKSDVKKVARLVAGTFDTTRQGLNVTAANEAQIVEKLNTIKALVEKVVDKRAQIFNDFFRVYVQTSRRFKSNTPKGLYTRYQDMRESVQSLADYYTTMNLSLEECVQLIREIDTQIRTCDDMITQSNFTNKVRVIDMVESIKDRESELLEGQIGTRAPINFNTFLERIDQLDEFLNASCNFFAPFVKYSEKLHVTRAAVAS